MKLTKNIILAMLVPILIVSCTTSPVLQASSQLTQVTKNTIKTPDMNIGERTRVGNLGFKRAQYEHLLPNTSYQDYDFTYDSSEAEIKRVKSFDLVKTPYAYTKSPEGVRYAILALVNPKTKEVAHSSIRIVSSTGTGSLIVDHSISDELRKQAPTRDFLMAIDADGRVFDLTEAPEGAKEYCSDKGCRYERAYDLEINPTFLFYYANGGALNLVSDTRPVSIYLPREMMIDFYNGLKEASQ